MTNDDIIETVYTLNDEIFTSLGQEYYAFEAAFDGTTSFVKFLGNLAWREDEDERNYDEESDTYEPLVDFLRRHAIQEIEKLSKIWPIPTEA